MKLSLKQTKILGLTMELNLKTRDYKALCDRFEELKASNLNPDAKEYKELRDAFLQNQQEIEEISKQLKQLKNNK